MRRPIKPFAVEKRRSGRRIPLNDVLDAPDRSVRFETPAHPAEPEEDSYLAALRAADALFNKAPEPTPAAEQAPAPGPAPLADQRRILQSLTEEDPIAQILAREAEDRPRRGRRPREPMESSIASVEAASERKAAPASDAVETAQAPTRIRGYVRGRIYALYARNDAVRPGEKWRKRARKPAW